MKALLMERTLQGVFFISAKIELKLVAATQCHLVKRYIRLILPGKLIF